MFDLPSLPNEILHRIIECVDPQDLERFSESYPLLENLFQKPLAAHHEREQEYTEICLQGCHRHRDDNHPLDLLRAICRDAKVALYPVSLTIECCGCREEEHTVKDLAEAEDLLELRTEGKSVDKWIVDASTVADIMANHACKIQELVMTCGYFSKKSREYWFDRIRRGNRGATLGLLLTLLPNLETLECDQYTWKARHFREIVRHITNPRGRKATRKHKKGAKILTQLHDVRFDGHEYGYSEEDSEEFFEDFDLAAYFAKLPSVRTMHASPAKNRSRQSNNPWIEVGSRTSNIEEITIIGGEMDAIYMSRCLGSVKALRKFDYDYSNSRDNSYALDRNGVVIILKALLEHATTSLELLSLHSGPWSPLEGSAAIPFSLNAFENLTNATHSCHLWAPVSIEEKEESENIAEDEAQPASIGREDSAVQESKLFKASRLVDILPCSMEVIKFYGAVAIRQVEAMLQGLIEHKANRLPRLEEIIYYEVALMEKADVAEKATVLREQCSGIGITLRIVRLAMVIL